MKRTRNRFGIKFIFVMAFSFIVPFLYSVDVVNDINLPSNIGEHVYKDRIVKISMTVGNVYTYVADKYTVRLQPGQNVKISIWLSSATLSYDTQAGLRFYFPNEAHNDYDVRYFTYGPIGCDVTIRNDSLNYYSFEVELSPWGQGGSTPYYSAAYIYNATFTFSDVIPPSIPYGMNSSNITKTSAKLSWNQSTDDSGIEGYLIQFSTLADYFYIGDTKNTSNTSINLTGLLPNTKYYYRVAAVDNNGNQSAYSSVFSFTTLADTTTPTLSGTITYASTGNNLTLSWPWATDDVAVTRYILTFNGTEYDVGNTTQKVFDSMTPGVYSYRVVAKDYSGNTSQALSGSTEICTINKNVTGNGSISTSCETPVFKNTTLNVTFVPNFHNLLVNGKIGTNEYDTVNPPAQLITSNTTISATFRPFHEYLVNVNKSGNGTVNIVGTDTVVRNGKTYFYEGCDVTVEITPDTHNFIKTVTIEGENKVAADEKATSYSTNFENLDANVQLDVAFRPMRQYTVTTHPSPCSIVIEGTDVNESGEIQKYYECSKITVSKILKEGYQFKKWVINGKEYTTETVMIEDLDTDLDVQLEVVSLYCSTNVTEDLVCDSGSLTFDTSADPPLLSGAVTYEGVIVDGVAVFDFNYVELGADCQVTITGTRPIAILSRTDMILNTEFDVSGAEAGRAGGGKGGAGGNGGEIPNPINGGLGGSGGAGGAGARSLYEFLIGWNYSAATVGSRGGQGDSGAIGSSIVKGKAGYTGEDATIAFGQMDYAIGSSGGEGGKKGKSGGVESLVGVGGNIASRGGNAGNAPDTATPGENGTSGIPGNQGYNTFSSDELTLYAGSAGSGGGGGGSGGSGGGGSGGSGGGGGGGCSNYPPQDSIPFPPTYPALVGGSGGKGGDGGNGGMGGVGGSGGTGGTGGNGGGAIVFGTRGTLFIGEKFATDISSYGRTIGYSGEIGNLGEPGESGKSGESGGQGFIGKAKNAYEIDDNWSKITVSGYQGASGGSGGNGSSGAKGGDGGSGGDGGYGAPGMIKLAASLILAENGVVKASNGNGDTAANRCGGVTYISNMTDAVLESHALSLADDARVVTGKAKLDDELMVKSSYNHSLLVPMLGQLETIHAGEYGICEDGHFALSLRSNNNLESTQNGVQLHRISGFYQGYDQLLFTNVSGNDIMGYSVVIDGGTPVVVESLPAGKTWTIAVESGATVSGGQDPTPTVQTMELTAGWNWVSFYVLPESHKVGDVLGTAGFAANDIIQTNGGTAARFSGTGWIGSFMVDYGKMYQIYVAHDMTVEISGNASGFSSVMVSEGWNWVGNPTAKSITPADLTHSGGWAAGDRIQTTGGAMTVYTGNKWLPPNFSLEPGQGYQIYTENNGTVTFK